MRYFHNRKSSPTLLVGLVLIGTIVLTSCATTNSTVRMSAEDRAALKSTPVIHVVRYMPGYMNMMTPASAAGFGLITRATGSAELPPWHELERMYAYPNASEEISNHLLQKLKAEGGLANLRLEPGQLPLPYNEDPGVYQSKYKNGLLLELSVPGRGAAYGVMAWKTYYYSLYAKARLIRLPDAKVVWSETCLVNSRSDPNLTFDVSEFEANNGARMKQIIRYSSERCSRILTDSLLGKS